SESAVTSSLASFKIASRTCELRAATLASWNISSRTRCQCGRSSRSPIAAMYSHASPIVRSVPPSFVGIAEVSFLDRYAGLNMTRKIQSIGQLLSPSLWPFLFALHQCIRVLHLEPIGASGGTVSLPHDAFQPKTLRRAGIRPRRLPHQVGSPAQTAR